MKKPTGHYGTSLYWVWAQMLQRCRNKKHKDYKHYGARGITVCYEWYLFINFYNWASQSGYKKGLTLDRQENDKNYCAENCRWVTQTVQTNNCSKNIFFTYKGETKTLGIWANGDRVLYNRLYRRIVIEGWTFERALNQPVRGKQEMFSAKYNAA